MALVIQGDLSLLRTMTSNASSGRFSSSKVLTLLSTLGISGDCAAAPLFSVRGLDAVVLLRERSFLAIGGFHSYVTVLLLSLICHCDGTSPATTPGTIAERHGHTPA
jgi:hypothetical protein